MLPDGIKAASPKAKSQPRKDFLARNELDLSAINLADAAPGFIGAAARSTSDSRDAFSFSSASVLDI